MLKMKEQRYESIVYIEVVVTSERNSVEVEKVQKAFTDLYARSKHYIQLGADYENV